MTSLVGNLRLAMRRIRRSPGFSLAILLTLALGIGVNTLIFSIVNAVLLAPLPYRQADRLVMAWEMQPQRGDERSEVSPGNFVDWSRQANLFEEMAAYTPLKMNVLGQGDPEQVDGVRVTPGFFDVLRITPEIGALPGKDSAADPVVVLSHAYWKTRFGGDRGVLGKALRIDDRLCQVAAVLPASFELPEQGVIWVTQPLAPDAGVKRGAKFLRVVARLAPGVSLERAKQGLTEVARRLEREYPETNQGWLADLVTLREQIVGPIRPVLLIAMTVVGFVLLLACINVVNLLLAREQGRRREIALRTALGARRQDLARQLLTETLLLAVIGGGLGLLLAYLCLPVLMAMSPVEVPRVTQVGIDFRVLAFTGALVVLTGLLFGVFPALSSTRLDVQGTLKEGGGKASSGAGGVWTRELLVMAEVGLAFAVLVSAGLMVRTCLTLLRTDPGFQPANLLTMKVLLPPSRYPGEPEKIAFFSRALEQLRALPGVAGVGATSSLPLDGLGATFDFRIEGRPAPGPNERVVAGFDSVTPGYFEAMGVPLRSGRTFTAADRADSAPVVIVSQELARRYWPGQDPVGQRLEILDAGDVGVREVVGVVGDVLHTDLRTAADPALYVPFEQYAVRSLGLVLKTHGEPGQAAAGARRTILDLDPELPVADVQSFERVLLASFARQRWTALLLSAFSLLGLVLAAVGIYGVMAYHSGQRAREIGIRMALGADRGKVLRLVLGRAARLTALGIVGGGIVAMLLGRSLSGLLFAVQPGDPVTFVATALFLGSVALLASFLPARRAAAVAPATVLRAD